MEHEPEAHIILVNDDLTQLTLYEGLLQRAGMAVAPFQSAEAALSHLQQSSRPDLIISDLNLPGIDGFRLCWLLRSEAYAAFHDVPILIASATFSGEETSRLVLALGANAFLPLPIESETFLDMVKALLSGTCQPHQPRALIVEDDLSSSLVVQKTLESAGYRVHLSTTLQQARELLTAQRFQVVLLDYHLPDGLGDSLLAAHHTHMPDTVWVMMTIDSDPDLALQWLQLGADAYIQKPFNPSYLVALVERSTKEHSLLALDRVLKNHSHQLRDSEERYQQLADSMPLYITRFLPNGSLVYINPSHAALFGKKPEQLIRQNLFDLLPREQARSLQACLAELTLNQPLCKRTERWIDSHGQERWQEWTNQAFHDARGQLLHFQSIGRDVTESQQLFNRLSFQAAVLDHIADFVTVSDMDGRILYTNKAVQAQFGLSAEQLVGKSVSLYGDDPDEGISQQELIRQVREKGLYQGDMVNLLPDGSRIILDTRVQLMEEQEPAVMVGITSNITERVQAEQALRESNQQLREALKELKETRQQVLQQERLSAIGQLSAGIAHDFRNNLNIILLHAELARDHAGVDHAGVDETAYPNLDTIIQSCHKAAALVDQILDFSRAAPVEQEEFDLADLLDELCLLYQRTLPENIIVQQVRQDESFRMQGDRNRLEQAVMNLILNACEAMPDGGNLTCSLSREVVPESPPAKEQALQPGEWIRLQITDDGHGIDPEIQDRIFEPYFTTRAFGKGTGLGLSQAYGILRQHNGVISLNSEPGKGTTFNLYLPPLDRKEPQDETAAALPCRPVDRDLVNIPQGQGQKVLLVDDSEPIRKAGARLLEHLGYTALTAGSGAEALALYEQEHAIELVIVDVVMPDMSGQDLARHLLAVNPAVKLIAISGYALDPEIFRECGFLDLVPKPFDLSTVSRILYRALEDSPTDGMVKERT